MINKVATFNNYPYYDDFDVNKNFYRILFRPGYSVQTREVNQLQTILQQQISHLADYSLVDRTATVGGNINFNKNVNFLKLTSGTSLSRAIYDYNDTVNFEAEDGITGTIMFVVPEDSTGPTTLYVKYLSSGVSNGKHNPRKNTQVTLLFADGNRETVQIEDTDTYSGSGTIVSLDESIFYIRKTFVKVNKQVVVLEKYNQGNIADYNIGILINEEVITAADDFTLYDNAYGTPNEAAQGADRYKISGILIDKSDVPEDKLENFIELIRLDKGEVAIKPKEENPVIPLLQQILARRTYDESGDYIVDTFDLDMREHLVKDKNNGVYKEPEGKEELLVAQLDPGVAYIRGYEVRIDEITRVNVPKARDSASVNNSVTQLNYSNYVIVAPTSGDVTIGGKINFLKSNNSLAGSAYISGVDVISSTQIKLYIININMTSTFDTVTKANAAGGVSSMVAFGSTFVSAKIANTYSPLIYTLPYGFSKNSEPTSLQFNKTYTTIVTNGIVSLSNEDSSETFSLNSNDYYVFVEGRGFDRPAGITGASNTVTLDVSNISASGQANVKVIAKIFATAPRIKTKTLVGNTGTYKDTISGTSLVNGRFTLEQSDGYRLIKVLDSNGADVSSKFDFDTGARDSHYGRCQLVVRSGIKLDTGTSYVVHYAYFSHSTSGDFFAVNSYVGIPYNQIPTYTDSSGTPIFMGSAYDFRKVISGDNINQESRGHVSLADRVISNITYYLPRKDRLMVTSASNIVLVKGVPDFIAKLPAELNDAITLYTLSILPYTFSINDVISEKMNHKRYTMKDIGKLENRITNVEEIALLNKLESDTASINFSDRFKSGYIVDNFSSSDTGDIDNEHFGVAYDLLDPSIRPKTVSDFIDMKLVSTESSNVKLHPGTGIVTLNYTVQEFIKQSLASDIVKIQPYITYGWGTGTMSINPAIDVWKEEYHHTNNIYTSTTNKLDDIIIKTSQNVGKLPT